MDRIINKLKPVLLLIGLTVLCVGIVLITRQFKEILTPELDYKVAQQTPNNTNKTTVENVTTDTTVPSKVEKNDTSGNVLAASTGNQCNAITRIDTESICYTESSAGVNLTRGTRSGDRVSINSRVVLTYVTVPLELFSGMEVPDSNRLITSEKPTFKAAGEQLDATSANVTLPPGKQIDEYKPWVEDEPFSTKYSMSFSGHEDTPTDNGELGVNTKLTNECEECNNKSNVNPDKSNKISEYMLDSTYRTPGEKDEVKDSDVIESCSKNSDRFQDWSSTYQGCFLSVPAAAIGFFQTISEAIWNECLAGNEEMCIDPTSIVLIMSSPFGSDRECNDGVCTNAYMSTRNNSALEPSSNASRKFYYTTPCKAIIQAKSYDIKCAWDMSHLYRERKVSELDDAPTLDSTPSDNSYNQFLLDQVNGKRGTQVPL